MGRCARVGRESGPRAREDKPPPARYDAIDPETAAWHALEIDQEHVVSRGREARRLHRSIDERE